MSPVSRAVVAAACALVACGHPGRVHEDRPPPHAQKGAFTLSIVGTNDLHGALDRLPLLTGYISNLRAARAADGGAVLLVDAGDLFQGTLESNIGEGADVVRAYNQMGYVASAVGNHEFDFGPAGPATTAKSIEEDPRGALKERAREAKFPFLVSNINDAQSHARIKWPNMPASTLVEIGGVKVGIVGASTAATPYTTMPANFLGLEMAPTATAIADEARALRTKGAQVIVVVAHIGSSCKDLDHPLDTSSCDHAEELFGLVDELPKGLIDVIVAGHTHAAIAHRISGIAVIESYSSGRAFGRIDLRVSADGHVAASRILRTQLICPLGAGGNAVPVADCHPDAYEGKPVVADPDVQAIVDSALAKAGARRNEKLGVILAGPITKAHGEESSEGDWFCDLMLAARPDAQVAVTNGGGLRADIPAGDLLYGQLFEAMPFDNRFAIVDVQGKHLRKMVSGNLQHGGAILSWGGLAAHAKCGKEGRLDLQITIGGKPLDEAATYKIATSDFLASGGDGLIGRLKLPAGSIHETDVIIRDALADVLRAKQGTVDPAKILSQTKRRMDYVGSRPVSCGGAGPGSGSAAQQEAD